MEKIEVYPRQGRKCISPARVLRIFNVVFVLLLLGTANLSATILAQNGKINLKVKNAPLKQVLQEIEKQSGFTFLYSDSDLDTKEEVTLTISDKSIKEVLPRVFQKSDINYSIVDNQVVLKSAKSSLSSQQEKRIIKGKVEDTNGQSLPGVTVRVKGTTRGTITDIDGVFSLEVEGNEDVILFTFVGMEPQEVNVSGKSQIHVQMTEETTGLDEVVVVGYGTQKKVNTTGAVAQVDGEVLESRPITNIADGLSNRVAGLNVSKSNGSPGSSASWNIRGFTGLSIDSNGNYVVSKRKPLILVDGIEQNPDLINPEDIESVSVLKDAAASAIYGSRAPYGVVLITTKKGKSGQLSVNYSSNFSWNSMIGVPKSVDGLTFANAFNEAYLNSQQGVIFSDETIEKIKAYMNGTGPSNTIGNDGLWGEYPNAHGNTDWMEEYFKDYAFSQRHTVSINGGLPNDKLSYYASFGFSEDNGLFKEASKDSYDRYNYNIKVTSKITDWLEATANIKYSRRNYERPNIDDNTILNSVGRVWPTTPAVNPDGIWHVNNKNWNLKNGGSYSDIRDDLTSKIGLKITPFEGFTISGNYTYNKFYRKYKEDQLTIEIPLPTGGVSLDGAVPNSVEEQMRNDDYTQVEAFMSYERSFGDHFGKIMVGHQSEEKKYNTLWGKKTELITQDVPSISTATGINSLDDNIEHWSTEGYFFRFNYNYKEKYLFEINSRYDASSRFPSDTRWAFFPSFSAGWNIARESFWNIDQISTLKLRGSYGKLGNANVSNYLYLPSLNYRDKTGVMLGDKNASAIDMPKIINPGITWEKPEVINIGLDVNAFNNRLNTSYEWYQRTIKDQLADPEEVSKVLGTNPPRLNNGVSETRGWEFSASWRDKLGKIKGKDVSYEVGFNLSDYTGYVVSFPNETGSMNGWTKGEVFGDIWGYNTVGLAHNVDQYNNVGSHHRLWSQNWYAGDVIYKDADGDGKVDGGNNFWYNKGDLSKLGNTTPRYQYGINLRSEWNGFDVDMFFEGVGKQDIVMNGYYFWGLVGSQWHSSLFEHNNDYYSATNKGAYFPRIYMGSEAGKNQKTQSRYVLDGAYLRFKTLQVGYNLPTNLLKKVLLSKCRLYLSVENLGVLYNASEVKLDPVVLRSGNGQIYPPQRTFSFGVNVSL